MKLTDSFIKAIKPSSGLKKYPDGNGLVLFAYPNGVLSWRYRYRFNGKEKMLSLGGYPQVRLKEARYKLHELKKQFETGADPSSLRKEQKQLQAMLSENSFQSIALKWHENWKSDKTPQHQKAVLNRLVNDLFPSFGSKPISDITAPQILMVVKKIEGRGAVDIAKRTYQTCGQVFRFAVAHGLCDRNPAKDIKPSDALKPKNEKNFARVDVKELPELLRKIDDYTNQGGNEITQLALQLMTYTFVRTNELIGTKWSEVDFKAREWVIPSERMKKIKGKVSPPHIIALSTQSIEIFKKLYEISGGRELVFPSSVSPLKPMSNNTLLYALYRLGYHSRMTGHGFRGIASTILHEQGYPHEHIELQLAHQKRDDVSRRYDYSLYKEPRAKMLQDWATYLDSIKLGAKVLNLKQA
jgi:integrase